MRVRGDPTRVGRQMYPRPLKWPPIFPLDKGLVAWYTFDDRSGATLYDRSGKRNHGTLYGPTWVAGRRGSALSFNGVSNYGISGSALGSLTSISLSCWIYTLTPTQAWTGFLGLNDAAHDSRLGFYSNTGKVFFRLYFATAAYYVNSLSALTSGEWHFITGTYNGVTDKMNLFVNAAQAISDPVTPNKGALDANYQVLVGKLSEDLFFSGLITKVYVHSRALNAAEIKRLYESELMLVRH